MTLEAASGPVLSVHLLLGWGSWDLDAVATAFEATVLWYPQLVDGHKNTTIQHAHLTTLLANREKTKPNLKKATKNQEDAFYLNFTFHNMHDCVLLVETILHLEHFHKSRNCLLSCLPASLLSFPFFFCPGLWYTRKHIRRRLQRRFIEPLITLYSPQLELTHLPFKFRMKAVINYC